MKVKKRKLNDENIPPSKSANGNKYSILRGQLKNEIESKIKFEKERELIRSKSKPSTGNDKKPNLVDILIKRTNSADFKINKNKQTLMKVPPKTQDKSCQTDEIKTLYSDDLRKYSRTPLSPNNNKRSIYSHSPSTYNYSLHTPTKNIHSLQSPFSSKTNTSNKKVNSPKNGSYVQNSPLALRDISNLPYKNICRNLESEFIDILNQENGKTEYESDVHVNFNSHKVINDSLSNSNKSSYHQESHHDEIKEEPSITSSSLPVDYYMEYIKILNSISKFTSIQDTSNVLTSPSPSKINETNLSNPTPNIYLDSENLLSWLKFD